jgi:hypothetical protein
MVTQTEAVDAPAEVARWTRARRWAAREVLAVLAAAAVLYVVNPLQLSPWLSCPFHAVTGLNCPGCGTVRGLHQLLHGHVLAAFRLNALSMSLLPFLGYPFLSNVMLVARGRGFPRVMVPWAAGWSLVAAVIAFEVLRNIPVWPLTLLAP